MLIIPSPVCHCQHWWYFHVGDTHEISSKPHCCVCRLAAGCWVYFSLSFLSTCSFSLCLLLRHHSLLSLPISLLHTTLQVEIRLQLSFSRTPRARGTLPAGRIGSRVLCILPQNLHSFVNHILFLPICLSLECSLWMREIQLQQCRMWKTRTCNLASFPCEFPIPACFTHSTKFSLIY